MARTPARNLRRDVNYVKPGEIGRTTGIKVPDLGPRDEHGFEPMDDLFSSPEKAPVTTNGDNEYTVTEDTMELVDSTFDGPQEVLGSGRRSTVRLPPPRSSPRKVTHIGGSARRSVGPEFSPPKRSSEVTPTTRASSHPAQSNVRTARLLKFGPPDEPPRSVERTPRNARSNSQLKRPTKTPPSGKRGKDIFDPPTEEEDMEEPQDKNGYITPPPLVEDEDDRPQLNGIEDEEPSMEDEPASEAKDESQAESGAEASNPDQAPNQKAGRPPKPLPRPVESPQQAEPSRGRGKKRKNPTIEAEARASKKRKLLAPAPTNRGPDTKLNKRAESKQPIAGSRSGSIRPNSRSLYEYRGTTPMNDAEHMTRFGRASYKPLNFWAGEKPVIEHGEIKEIIRAEKVATPDRPKSIGNRRGAKAKKRKGGLRNVEEEEEDEADMEDWETQGGILSAQVMQWDSMQNTHIEDEFEEVEVAYASSAIQTRDINGGASDPSYIGPNFKFAKLLSMPFFGAGMVDLTPGGIKRSKNSRRMQMVFFVFYGRVTVEIGNDIDSPKQSFGIGKGGMWQVPRGNWYAVHNHSDKYPARIFFAQGCHMPQPSPDAAAASAANNGAEASEAR